MTYAENALTTVERAIQFFGLLDDTVQDYTHLHTNIIMAINKASAAIEAYCGRSFRKALYTQAIRVATDEIITEQYPLYAVYEDAEKTTPLPNIYFIDSAPGIVDLEADYKGIIHYEAGYILPKDATEEQPATLPVDLEECCLQLAEKLYIDDDGYLGNVENIKLGDWSTKLGGVDAATNATLFIPASIQSSLNLHKRAMFYDE